MPLDVEVLRPDERSVVVSVTGEVDVSTAPLLHERLIDIFAQGGPREHLVVDLARVPFIDSTGLGVLVGAHRRAAAAGARMTVIASGNAYRAIMLTGLDRVWTTIDATGGGA